jgi:hypothetical protein
MADGVIVDAANHDRCRRDDGLFVDPLLRARMSTAAADRVRREFSPDALAARVCRLLELSS